LKPGPKRMSTSSVNSISNSSVALAGDSSARIPNKTLGQDEFLRLLIAQLSSQDPLNPQKDTEFISQMAQFSSLEQAKGMQSSLAALHSQQEFVQANAMLGREVNVQIDQDTFVKGLVSSVNIESGRPRIVIDNQSYDISSVLSVAMFHPQAIQTDQKRNITK